MKLSIKPLAFSVAFSISMALSSLADVLLSPGDQIIGGVLDAAEFTEGNAGTSGGLNNWPGAEPPEELIDGQYGGGNAKYLNFFELNTGVIITPSVGATVVTSMTLWTANDAVARDPASYELYGTNATIEKGGPGTTYAKSDFTLISSGPVTLPAERNNPSLPIGDAPYTEGFRETIAIDNSTSYTSYMLIFPTVKNAGGANSMQLSEAAFEGTIGVGGLFAVTEVRYDRDSDVVTITWTSSPGQTYTLFYSPDMTVWDTDIEDSIDATPDSETTTFGPFPNPIPGRPDGFFIVVRNP